MSALDDQVARLKARIESVTAARARAEHEQAVAEDAFNAARSALEQEFGVTTTEEAQAALARAEGEVAAECKRCADLLD